MKTDGHYVIGGIEVSKEAWEHHDKVFWNLSRELEKAESRAEMWKQIAIVLAGIAIVCFVEIHHLW